MRVDFFVKISKKNGKDYKNWYIKTDSGLEFQVKYAFYNSKLAYRLEKEIEETAKTKKK